MELNKILSFILRDSVAMMGVIAIVGILVWVFVINPSMPTEFKQIIFVATFLGVYGIIRILALRKKKKEA